MDGLTLIHLFFYPMLTGTLMVGFVWAAKEDFLLLMFALYVGFVGMLILSFNAHANYQGYLFG